MRLGQLMTLGDAFFSLSDFDGSEDSTPADWYIFWSWGKMGVGFVESPRHKFEHVSQNILGLFKLTWYLRFCSRFQTGKDRTDKTSCKGTSTISEM
jgi:hypothetical protein